jgi:hypothetical protein
MQEDVESIEARELVYATDTDGRAEWNVNSHFAALRGHRVLLKMLAREQKQVKVPPRRPALPRVSSAEGFPQAPPRDRRQRRGR